VRKSSRVVGEEERGQRTVLFAETAFEAVLLKSQIGAGREFGSSLRFLLWALTRIS
jgi:hypothetical protein